MAERNARFAEWCSICHKSIVSILDTGVYRHLKRDDDLDHQAQVAKISPNIKGTISPDKLG